MVFGKDSASVFGLALNLCTGYKHGIERELTWLFCFLIVGGLVSALSRPKQFEKEWGIVKAAFPYLMAWAAFGLLTVIAVELMWKIGKWIYESFRSTI